MRKLLMVSCMVCAFAGTSGLASAQGCPGVAPYVFDDVPFDDPFCPVITEMAQRGITDGCFVIDANHRLFCPDTAVSRRQMAAFLARPGPAIKVNAVHTGNWIVNSPDPVLVPLTGAGPNGDTVVNWTERSAVQRVLTYSAECSVDTSLATTGLWLDIDIIVNGQVVPPTVGNQDAFCSSDGTVLAGGWTRASITVVINTVVGANAVSIQARGSSANITRLHLGDSALVIH